MSSSGDESFTDIREYFSASEWTELCSYEKASYRSSKRNFELMKEAGLTPQPPKFMRHGPVLGPEDGSHAGTDENSDSTRTPKIKVQSESGGGRPKKERPESVDSEPRRSSRIKRANEKYQAPEFWVQGKSKQPRGSRSTPGGASNAPMRSTKRSSETPTVSRVSRYPLRSTRSNTCYDQTVLIPDSKVVPGDPERALNSTPWEVTVLTSRVDGEGLGVWTREVISANMRFGPYVGDVPPVTGKKETGSVDMASCNWMRYVQHAREYRERNLEPYEVNGQLYYRTTRSIPPYTELLVWYGDSNATEPVACPRCCLGFISPLQVNQHLRAAPCKALPSSSPSSTLVRSERDVLEETARCDWRGML